MKLEKREIEIKKEEYYWIATDGKEFARETECRNHEAELQKSKAKSVFKTEKGVYDLVQPSTYYEDVEKFYYIKTEEDMQNLWIYFELEQGKNAIGYDRYNYQGEGWYVKTTTEIPSSIYSTDYFYRFAKVDVKSWKDWLEQFDWIKELNE